MSSEKPARRIQSNSTSGIRGVTWDKRHSKWRAVCQISGKQKYLGLHETKEEAKAAYEAFADKHGVFDKVHVKPILTQEYLKSQLHYDPDTGVFTRLVSNVYSVKVGSVAGTPADGYVQIHLQGRNYRAHRLAWLYMTGEMPDKTVDMDHVNMDRSDNRWANLRLASRGQNMQNRPKQRHNSSGYKGVVFHPKSGKWRAVCRADGVTHHIGLYYTPEEASAAYQSTAAKLHGEFFRSEVIS